MNTASTEQGKNIGKIVQVIGPTVDVEFSSDRLPNILNAIKIEDKERDIHLTCEVALHVGDNVVRTIAMSTTDGLVRGMEAIDTGGPISMPVGAQTLGRVFNLLGEPIDNKGPVAEPDKTHSIHRDPPSLEDQSTETAQLETGIKVVDLLAP